MRAVQELGGHQDLTMTQRYAHLSPAALIDTVRLLESRVGRSTRRRRAFRPELRESAFAAAPLRRDSLRVN
jgi:hypothetical protein